MTKQSRARKHSPRVEKELSTTPKAPLGSPPQALHRRPKPPLETYTVSAAGRCYGPFVTADDFRTVD